MDSITMKETTFKIPLIITNFLDQGQPNLL